MSNESYKVQYENIKTKKKMIFGFRRADVAKREVERINKITVKTDITATYLGTK